MSLWFFSRASSGTSDVSMSRWTIRHDTVNSPRPWKNQNHKFITAKCLGLEWWWMSRLWIAAKEIDEFSQVTLLWEYLNENITFLPKGLGWAPRSPYVMIQDSITIVMSPCCNAEDTPGMSGLNVVWVCSILPSLKVGSLWKLNLWGSIVKSLCEISLPSSFTNPYF
jgi:hypothetical protein